MMMLVVPVMMASEKKHPYPMTEYQKQMLDKVNEKIEAEHKIFLEARKKNPHAKWPGSEKLVGQHARL